jgi:ankyrin repeat protein
VPVISLPDRPSLEHLKNEAKTLQRRVRAGSARAVALVREFHPQFGSVSQDDPRLAAFSRSDAQLVVSRRYGFPSWPRLREQLDVRARYSRYPDADPATADAADAEPLADRFLRLACLNYAGFHEDRLRQAGQLLAERPDIATASIWASAAVGEYEHVSELLSDDPGLVGRQGGPFRWEPLLYAAYSRVPDPAAERSTLEVARRLLAAGADPNAGYLWHGLPCPFTALTGAFGRGEGAPPAHPQAVELASLLLESGADPNDAQALYNCGLQSPPDDDWYLRLLLRYGLGRRVSGPWQARLGTALPSPAELLDQELRKAASDDTPDRARLLLAHGADPASYGTGDPSDGDRNSWEIATFTGHAEVLAVLSEAAEPPEPDPVHVFLGACMSGDDGTVQRMLTADPGLTGAAFAMAPDVIVRAVEEHRPAAVRLLVQVGFDVNQRRRYGAPCTPLHEAAWSGDLEMISLLLGLGADPRIRDRLYDGTPAGWASYNGQDEAAAYLEALEPSG